MTKLIIIYGKRSILAYFDRLIEQGKLRPREPFVFLADKDRDRGSGISRSGHVYGFRDQRERE